MRRKPNHADKLTQRMLIDCVDIDSLPEHEYRPGQVVDVDPSLIMTPRRVDDSIRGENDYLKREIAALRNEVHNLPLQLARQIRITERLRVHADYMVAQVEQMRCVAKITVPIVLSAAAAGSPLAAAAISELRSVDPRVLEQGFLDAAAVKENRILKEKNRFIISQIRDVEVDE